jgi:hypothetical protein
MRTKGAVCRFLGERRVVQPETLAADTTESWGTKHWERRLSPLRTKGTVSLSRRAEMTKRWDQICGGVLRESYWQGAAWCGPAA